MVEVSIIILTYNSEKYIEDLLISLKKFIKNNEIIIIDNSSVDQTLNIANKFDFVKVFESSGNIGFAKGINLGAKKATGKYLLFINPDAQFKEGEIKNLTDLFIKYEKVGVVGGKLLNIDKLPEKSAGKFFNLFEAISIAIGLDEKLGVRFSPEKTQKVDFVSGGFMMVDKDLFNKLNGFDEEFFMYVEDMEFCYRVKKEGYNIYFTPNVVLTHIGQGSSNRNFAILNIYKGMMYFFRKHKSPLEYNIVKLVFCSKAIFVYLLGIFTNNSYYKDTYKQAFLAIK